MKLIVIIPAYNEAKTVAGLIREIPRNIQGVDRVEILVLDETGKAAKEAGADYVISNQINRGLAYSFRRALKSALKLEADIIVNIDADLQYNPSEISKLIQPVLEGRAEMVIGNRQVGKLKHMKFSKKYGNIILSWVMRIILKSKVSDASSGFRAFSRECARRLNIFSSYTYTHETIIQCVFQKMRISEVPVEFRKREDGSSRLIRNLWDYIKLAGMAIVIVSLIYKPLKVFSLLSLAIFGAAIAVAVYSTLFTPKLLDTTVMILSTTALQTFFFGLIAALITHTRNNTK